MEVLPALDLQRGQLVRLHQGRYDRVRRYRGGPVETALAYVDQGALRLHVVDLDGARSGGWRNLEVVGEMVSRCRIPLQLGGGGRDRAQLVAALALGVDRVIVSTAALRSRSELEQLLSEFGDKLIVSLDARAGLIVTEGWTSSSGLGLAEAGRLAVECGVSRLIYTDVLRDGGLGGPGLDGLGLLLPLGVPVLVAGGVSSYRDLERLRDRGAAGAVIGRALLERRVSLRRAMAVAMGHAD